MSPAPSSAPAAVFLVGAGPGDPGLLTVRARELLGQCDAIVYDALVNPLILSDDVVRTAELHFVGKRGGTPHIGQDAINALLVRLAREGKRVVRLKGGDPMVFGRGGEEALALAAAGIPFEIVPGVTAGIAAPAYAGIPVTHRGVSTAVTFVTGHEDADKETSDVDWAALAALRGTLVLYMGVRRLPEIVDALRSHGLPPETPVAVIEWGTYPHQRTVGATLSSIVDAARRDAIAAPSITVVGDVARLRDEIRWFDARPLSGKRILVTRARTQASELAARLRALGAQVIEAPAIRIEPLDPTPLRDALARRADYQWLVLTSRNAVDIVWTTLRALGLDARALGGLRIAAVGPATADALLERGIAVDVVPDRYTAEGVADAMRTRTDVAGTRVVFAKAEGARDVLPASLREQGAHVDEIAIYRSVPDADGAAAARDALERGDVDLVTFTSASTVRFFVDAVGADAARRTPAVTMGPITSDTARALGVRVDREADEATLDGLVRAACAVLAAPESRTRDVAS